MQPAREDTFHLRHQGQLIEVEVESTLMEPVARLLIDGEHVDQQSTWPQVTHLQGPEMDVYVQWTLLSSPQRAWAVFDAEKSTAGEDPEGESNHPEHDLTPPAGTWAERVTNFANDHPNVYASRHVIKATLQAILGILGVGAILWGLLPRLDIHLPIPDLEIGDWIRSIVPGWVQGILQLPQRAFTWLFGWIPEITFVDRFIAWIRTIGFPPAWLESVASSARYWIPVVLALGVALQEIERRNKNAAKTSETEEPISTNAKQPGQDGHVEDAPSIEDQDSLHNPEKRDTNPNSD